MPKQRGWGKRVASLLFASLGLFLLAAPAAALPIAAFTGNTYLDDGAVDGTINYAVFTKAAFLVDAAAILAAFKPGMGSPDLNANTLHDAGDLDLSGSGYVYLYQQTNNGPNTFVISGLSVSSGSSPITSWGYFTHRIFKDSVNALVTAANNLGVDTLPAGGSGARTGVSPIGFALQASAIDPSSVKRTSTSIKAVFGFNGIASTKTGSLVVFTSPGAPDLFTAHIDDHGTSAYGAAPAPEPVPEPGTLLLLGSGLAGAVAWGTKVRRRLSSRQTRAAASGGNQE